MQDDNVENSNKRKFDDILEKFPSNKEFIQMIKRKENRLAKEKKEREETAQIKEDNGVRILLNEILSYIKRGDTQISGHTIQELLNKSCYMSYSETEIRIITKKTIDILNENNFKCSYVEGFIYFSPKY